MMNRTGRVLVGIWRVLLISISGAALLWTGASIVGCSGLKTAITTVSQDPTLAYAAPGDWDNPADGSNGAPYFAASMALMAYAYPAQANAIEIVVRCGWQALPEGQRAGLQAWLKQQRVAFDLASKGADQPWCRYSREWWIDQGRKTEREPWRISSRNCRELGSSANRWWLW